MVKRILSIIMALAMLTAMTLIPSAASNETTIPYTDVKETDWFFDCVSEVYNSNLMVGTAGNRFEPQTAMSRAMFITVLGRLDGAEQSESDRFSDIKKNSWYSGYVGWATDNNIVDGYENNTFKPDSPVSREEAATFISRYIKYADIMLDWSRKIPDKFKDNDAISAWAEDSVFELSLSSIFVGDQNGNFNASSGLTRAEAAAIFTRLATAVQKSESASAIVSAYDMINTPEMLYSNMDTVLNTQEEYPVMDFEVHEYFSAPWYIGINYIESDINAGALEYTKICYKTDSNETPYLKITSPVFESGNVEPIEVSEEDGYTTAVFKTGDLIRTHRENYLTAENPYEEYGKKENLAALINLNIRSLYSTYLKIAVYPFGEDENPSADVLYLAFFADEDSAKAFTASDSADYFKNGRDENSDGYIAQANDEIINKYKDEMSKRTEEILNAENAVTPDDITGTCYYISSVNGDDSNDGLSPETPWKSFQNLFYIKMGVTFSTAKPGDGVFLERGSVFYSSLPTNYSGDSVLSGASGVTYAAYGEGDKPILTGAVDVNGSMNWEETGYKNVWKLSDVTLPGKIGTDGHEDAPGYNDVGNIVVTDKNGKTGWGIKVIPTNPVDPYAEGSMTLEIGTVSNGFETFETTSVPCENPSALKHNLEYLHDFSDGSIYMYYNGGNPGKVFDNIVVVKRGDIMPTDGCNVLIDNIAFKYAGSGGLSTGDASNFTVQNCTFEWIGGSMQNENNYIDSPFGCCRFGNGIQNWANADGFYIKNCYFNQIYDGAASTQVAWKDVSIVNDFNIIDCVFKNSNSPVEIWNLAHDEVSANFTISGNYFANDCIDQRYGAQRRDGGGHSITYKSASFISLSSLDQITHERFIVEDNVFFMDNAKVYAGRQFLYRGDDNGVLTRNNVLIGGKENSSDIFATLPDVDLRNSAYPPNSWEIRYNYIGYTKDFIDQWVALGCDRGSTFYFVK